MMNFVDAVTANLLTPAVLFFVMGVIAALVKTDLKFPEALYITLTVYLLTAIGFKGGVSLSQAGLAEVWLPIIVTILLGACIPLWCYPVLRLLGKLGSADAAAVSATYGSVSAVTFIVATNYLTQIQIPYENYTAAFMAVMESPAIIAGILMGKLFSRDTSGEVESSLKSVMHEALLGRSIFLLLGSLIVGALCGQAGMAKVEGFFVTPFQGILALFLLEMGFITGRRMAELRNVGLFLLAFGITMPFLHGLAGVFIGKVSGLSLGGATLFGVLAASASYIAAPAALRMSLPQANPALYLTPSLAVTFPFNVTIGIPLYFSFARWLYLA
jgi:hypothetical protein